MPRINGRMVSLPSDFNAGLPPHGPGARRRAAVNWLLQYLRHGNPILAMRTATELLASSVMQYEPGRVPKQTAAVALIRGLHLAREDLDALLDALGANDVEPGESPAEPEVCGPGRGPQQEV